MGRGRPGVRPASSEKFASLEDEIPVVCLTHAGDTKDVFHGVPFAATRALRPVDGCDSDWNQRERNDRQQQKLAGCDLGILSAPH